MQPQHVFYNFEFVSCLLLPAGVTLSFVSSSVEDDSDPKRLSKEEKGRSSHSTFPRIVFGLMGRELGSSPSYIVFLPHLTL